MQSLLPANIRDFTMCAIWTALTVILTSILGMVFGVMPGAPGAFSYIYLFAAFTSGIVISMILMMLVPRKVDPWAMQRSLMRASGQDLPNTVVLTKNALMYHGLIVEELAETLDIVGVALRNEAERERLAIIGGLPPHHTTPGLATLASTFSGLTLHLSNTADLIKRELKRMPSTVRFNLNRHEAITLADGHTDLVVVTAGAALASGIPGADCYEEVADSNLSKANPATGLIDKDATGKWIKGSAYHDPDLAAVLDAHERLPQAGLTY